MKGRESEDHCILSHSNRICIVTLAPSHPIIANKKGVTSVNFKVNEDVDRLNNKVSGKSKRGAQILKANSPLCIVTCEDGCEYTVYSCIRGMLVEVNENLTNKPSLLVDKNLSIYPSFKSQDGNLTCQFQTDGYIAVVLPRLQEFDREMKTLLSSEDYMIKVQERQNESASAS